MSAVCLPGSQQVWGLYLITTRLNSLRQWRLIWRGGPGLSLHDPVPNTITPLFRYPAVCYNFAIFQCQGPAFWRVFIEFPAGPCCRGHFLSSLHCCHQAFFVKTPLDLLLFLSFFFFKGKVCPSMKIHSLSPENGKSQVKSQPNRCAAFSQKHLKWLHTESKSPEEDVTYTFLKLRSP